MRTSLPAVIATVDDLPAEAPWERLPGESTAAYRMFVHYREMDATVRSITRLAKEHGRSPGGHIRTWASDYFWTARVGRWDEYLDAQARDAQVRAVRDAASIRAQVALGMFEKLYDRMFGKEAVIDMETGELLESAVTPLDPEKLDAKDIAALAGIAGKLLVSSAEHTGEKPLDEQRVNVTLAFDLDGSRAPAVIDGHATVVKTSDLAHGRELPRGEPDAA